jgi:hypothetical protein
MKEPKKGDVVQAVTTESMTITVEPCNNRRSNARIAC